MMKTGADNEAGQASPLPRREPEPATRADALPGQAGRPPGADTEDTALPILRSWKAVYFFVLASFAVWIALLIALTKAFS